MLPRGELDRLRADIEGVTLVDTCDIYSVTRSADGYGGVTETWTALYSGVKCRMDQTSGREQLAGGAWQWFSKNMLSLPATTAITTAHRVYYGGVMYAVMSVNEGSRLGVKRVVLERI